MCLKTIATPTCMNLGVYVVYLNLLIEPYMAEKVPGT